MKMLQMPTYCAPERVSSSHLAEDAELAYAAAGIKLEFYCPTPTRGVTEEERKKYKKIKYEEKLDGSVIIHRFFMFREGKNPILRALRYSLVQLVQYAKAVRTKDVDIVYGASTPPTQGILCAKVAKRLSKKYGKKVPFVFGLQDVFPDSLAASGLSKEGSFLYNIGTQVANYTYRNADAIVAISEDIKRNIMEKGVPAEKIHVIYNWIDTDAVRPISREENRLFEELGLSRDTFKVVYAGNLGKAQGIDTVLDAAKALQEKPEIEFLIFGRGVEEENLKKRAEAEKITNVRFFPLMPAERVPEVYSLGDCCVVCCTKGTGGAGVPSKTWTIMACGRPLVVSFDEGSELCRTVEKAGAGLCCQPEDGKLLAAQVLELYSDTASTAEMGNRARAYAEVYAGKDGSMGKYVELIKETVKEA